MFKWFTNWFTKLNEPVEILPKYRIIRKQRIAPDGVIICDYFKIEMRHEFLGRNGTRYCYDELTSKYETLEAALETKKYLEYSDETKTVSTVVG